MLASEENVIIGNADICKNESNFVASEIDVGGGVTVDLLRTFLDRVETPLLDFGV